jgi:histidine triad (HIT) family protein
MDQFKIQAEACTANGEEWSMAVTDPNCIFCKIVAGAIPAKKVLETEDVVAFHDINPKAPTHVLLIPREHIATINDLTNANARLIGQLLLAAKRVAQVTCVDASGYRLVFNCGPDAGMEVHHIHLHLLGGRPMTWPPG